MARRLDQRERERLIMLSGKLAENKMGVNEISRFLLETENIKISSASVSNFIKTYQKIHFNDKVDYTLKDNRGDVSNKDVEKRVLENAKSLLEGKTVKEISEETNQDYYKVYRDLTIRLPRVNKELSIQVRNRLLKNKEENRKIARQK